MESNTIINKLRGDKVIWIIVFALSLISIAAVYSSSSSLAFRENKSTFSFLIKQMRFVIFGLTALYICYRIPLGWYRKLSYLGIIIAIGLLLATLLFGVNLNNAERWLQIFGVKFQTTEIAKVATILYVAKILEDREFILFKEFFIWLIMPVGAVIVMIFIGSTSTAVVMSGLIFLMLVIAGLKWKHIFKTIGLVLIFVLLSILLNKAFGFFPRMGTTVSRLTSFVSDKEVHEELSAEEKQKLYDKTLQADMAKIAIGSGGVLGKGPGNSTQRYILPHPYSDFIYAVIIEEWGFFGGFAILILYLWFFYRCAAIATRCKKMFSTMLVIGLALLITTQAALHILVNVGLFPVTGHTLPLISLGGTSFIVLSGAFGMILSVSRTLDKEKEKKEATDEIVL